MCKAFKYLLCYKINHESMDVIDQVYESLNIHRALFVCANMRQMEIFKKMLEEKNYPCGFDQCNQLTRLLITNPKHLKDSVEINTADYESVNVVFCLNNQVFKESMESIEKIGTVASESLYIISSLELDI